MYKYEIGREYPHRNFKDKGDFTLASINENLFDIIIGMEKPSNTEQKIIRQEPLRYGVYINKNVPFILFDFRFQNYSFDCSINFYKVKSEERENWLKTESNIINLSLVDTSNNIMKGVRLISVEIKFIRLIKQSLKMQLTSMHPDDIEKIISEVYTKYSTNELIYITKMYSL